jgi:hypothetical protein
VFFFVSFEPFVVHIPLWFTSLRGSNPQKTFAIFAPLAVNLRVNGGV